MDAVDRQELIPGVRSFDTPRDVIAHLESLKVPYRVSETGVVDSRIFAASKTTIVETFHYEILQEKGETTFIFNNDRLVEVTFKPAHIEIARKKIQKFYALKFTEEEFRQHQQKVEIDEYAQTYSWVDKRLSKEIQEKRVD